MSSSVQTIPLINLALALIPVIVVVGIGGAWGLGYTTSLHATGRMLLQLLLIGYVLGFIFEADNAWIVVAVLSVMLMASSLIALRTMEIARKAVVLKSLWSIAGGGGLTLVLMTQGVLNVEPWYLPSYVIPLAGMSFASAMNAVSLAGERLAAELDRNIGYREARRVALRASLIPVTNSLFAVGIVSLPGMMTGQILSGISPLIAARYQIMVMCMIFGSAGVASALFLASVGSDFEATVPTAQGAGSS